jgi:ABC-type antimicrobial peptide transport system permease subunit
LNLNLVQQPAILGLNAFKLNERGSFSFAKLHPLVDSDKPWLFLDEKLEGKVVPVFLDQTVIQWGLMKKVGDTIVAVNEYGESLSLLIAGGLEASIFQGNILMGQSYFKKHFPSRGGAAVFLVDAPVNEPHVAKELLSLYLNDFGIELQSTAERLAQFNAVTNTYLNIFMLLGGLAVLIGTVGFGIVILRSLLERKKEIAILMAIGIQNKTIMRWFAVEYMFLLGASLLLGLLGALIGMLPTFFSESFDMPYQYLLILLGIIVFNGFLWVVSIVQIVVKQHNVKALKEE